MNPVNAYLLIKRLTRDWQRIRQLMNANPGDQFIKNITGVREANAVKYPDDEDLDGAAQGLLRLQANLFNWRANYLPQLFLRGWV
ncbi:hypothetical protein niasHS_013947 [Heterodera schachtii]|uniref:Prolyl 4-hydroxylase N-terminal domain-containing protein n=2 Tax=Heterodera TaxID=34509 RepID=A0ABD2IQV8_HETSC